MAYLKILMEIISYFFFRQQVTEIIFVLKAVSTLIDSLKKTQPENGKCLKLSYSKLITFMFNL